MIARWLLSSTINDASGNHPYLLLRCVAFVPCMGQRGQLYWRCESPPSSRPELRAPQSLEFARLPPRALCNRFSSRLHTRPLVRPLVRPLPRTPRADFPVAGTVLVGSISTPYATITERKLRCKCTTTTTGSLLNATEFANVGFANCNAYVDGVLRTNIYNLFDYQVTVGTIDQTLPVATRTALGLASQAKQQQLYTDWVEWRNDIVNGMVAERERERMRRLDMRKKMRLLGEGFTVGANKLGEANGEAKGDDPAPPPPVAQPLANWAKPSNATMLSWASNNGHGIADLKYAPTREPGSTADEENRKWCIDTGFQPTAHDVGSIGLLRHMQCNIRKSMELDYAPDVRLIPCVFMTPDSNDLVSHTYTDSNGASVDVDSNHCSQQNPEWLGLPPQAICLNKVRL